MPRVTFARSSMVARNSTEDVDRLLRDVRPVTGTKKMSDRVTERTMSLRTRIFLPLFLSLSSSLGNEMRARIRVGNNYFLFHDRERRWFTTIIDTRIVTNE